MPPDLIFLVVTAIVGTLLVLGAALATVRERSIASGSAGFGVENGQGKYDPEIELAEAHAGASASASVSVVRVLWWITIAAVLVGVGLSDAYRANQALDANNEDLAKKALAKKAECDRQVASMQTSIDQAKTAETRDRRVQKALEGLGGGR